MAKSVSVCVVRILYIFIILLYYLSVVIGGGDCLLLTLFKTIFYFIKSIKIKHLSDIGVC